MKSPHLVEGDTMTPLGSAAIELHTLHGWGFHEAAERLQEAFEQDAHVPVSGMFPAREARRFYARRGEKVNVVGLPRR